MMVMPPIECPASTTGPAGHQLVQDRGQVAAELVDRRARAEALGVRRRRRPSARPRPASTSRARAGRSAGCRTSPAAASASAWARQARVDSVQPCASTRVTGASGGAVLLDVQLGAIEGDDGVESRIGHAPLPCSAAITYRRVAY